MQCTAHRQQKAANTSLLESKNLLQTATLVFPRSIVCSRLSNNINILAKKIFQAANGGGHGPPGPPGSATARGYLLSWSITAPWPVWTPAPSCTAWWQRHTGVSWLLKITSGGARPKLEPPTCESQVRCHTNSAVYSQYIKQKSKMDDNLWLGLTLTLGHCEQDQPKIIGFFR